MKMPNITEQTDHNYQLVHRRSVAATAVLMLLAGFFLFGYARHRLYVGCPLKADFANQRLLADKINPNTASWASLSRLPGIGPARAQAMVSYREEFRRQIGSNGPAFKTSGDLERVKGIGQVIAGRIEKYLIFEQP